MTEQIYNSDAYKQELESKIIEINEDYIVLDKTIFFQEEEGSQMILVLSH